MLKISVESDENDERKLVNLVELWLIDVYEKLI